MKCFHDLYILPTVNCPAIPTPPYPSLIVTSGGLTEGATVIYSCAPGYNLNGGAQQVCVDGIWTGREPTCTGRCLS